MLRGSDMCAIGVHVYGGDYNTASILGRYGNPVQDYLAALDLPLVNPGKINLVPVGNDCISQTDAATGTQTKEITKLGDNVVDSTNNKTIPEFWAFDGFKEIFDVTVGIATTLGPVLGGPLGSVITPIIITAIQASRPGPAFDMDLSLQRAVLANTTLLIAEAKHSTEEGWFEDFTRTIGAPMISLLGPSGTIQNMVKPRTLPFNETMEALGVKPSEVTILLEDVAAELTRVFITSGRLTKSENVLNDDAVAVSKNEAAFLENFSRAIGNPKEESWLGDLGNMIQKTTNDAVNVVSDATRLVNDLESRAINTVITAGADIVDKTINQPITDVFGISISPDSLIKEQGRITILILSPLEY